MRRRWCAVFVCHLYLTFINLLQLINAFIVIYLTAGLLSFNNLAEVAHGGSVCHIIITVSVQDY